MLSDHKCYGKREKQSKGIEKGQGKGEEFAILY
jgi:hypothetical protein